MVGRKYVCVVVKVTNRDAFVLTEVMEKVDEAGNVLGFSVLRVSALGAKPLEISL